MSDREYLPEFIREALEADSVTPAAPLEGGDEAARSAREQRPGQAIGEAVGPSELRGIEHCLGALLEVAWPEDATMAGASGSGAAGRAEDFAPSAALFDRLESSLRDPAYRYAPFFSRAAELFDLPEASVAEALARLAEPKTWRFAGLPGIHHAAIDGGPKVRSAETLFVRFAPGVRFPKHRHTGIERVLVLEGSYRDSAGVVHRAGELREWAEGSEHGFVVDTAQPCIFASVVFGRRFSAWPLRALASVLGR
jgi:hypothetical protein